MLDRIKFHLDENISNAIAKRRRSLIAQGLRRRGIDVTTTPEVSLISASDKEQRSFAFREARVIFTQDDDFLKLHQAGFSHFGITYCRQRSRSIGEIINTLTLIWEWVEPDDFKGQIEFI
jgi:predicted nuclease of predicted toxin-antitoxin system